MNMRAAGQTFIGCWCDADFVAKVDNARKRDGLNRSQFARLAIAEKLRSLKVPVGISEYASPDRAGKGGPKASADFTLNDKPGSPAKPGKEAAITNYTEDARKQRRANSKRPRVPKDISDALDGAEKTAGS